MQPLPLSSQSLPSLSAALNEPSWLRATRLASWERYESLIKNRNERWADLLPANALLTAPAAARGETIPRHAWPLDLHHTLEERGDEEGLIIQRDTEILSRAMSKEPAKKGVLFTDLTTASRDYPDLVRPWIDRDLQTGHPDVAFTNAFWSRGAFIYVPAHQRLFLPLHACYWLSRSERALFPRLVVVAEKGSRVVVVDETLSSETPGSLVSGLFDFWVGPGARVDSFSLASFGAGVSSTVRTRVTVEAGGTFHQTRVVSGEASSKWVDDYLGEGVSDQTILALNRGKGHHEFTHRPTTTGTWSVLGMHSDELPNWTTQQVASPYGAVHVDRTTASEPCADPLGFVAPFLKRIVDPSMQEKMTLYMRGKITGERPPFSLHRVSLLHPEVRM